MANGYHFDGEDYKAHSRPQKDWGMAVIDSLQLKGDESIIDLGCGDGVLSAELARRVPRGRVLGLDNSSSMIETARSNWAPNLDFRLQDLTHMDFSEVFDLAFSNAALHWIKDQDTFLLGLHRALKPGGCLRFNFAGDGNCPSIFRGMREAMSHPRFTSYFASFEWPWHMPSAGDYEIKLRAAGFRDIEVWMQDADRAFENAQEFSKFIVSMGLVPLLERVPEGRERAAFEKHAVTSILEHSHVDGGYFEVFRRINVKARK
ncbi:MAG: methyltransferase domain-containing protein [Methanomassiliicoccales archaeon]|nr:methyltransferase domain-containing protein [Methanomassiliicoccales archaeon]